MVKGLFLANLGKNLNSCYHTNMNGLEYLFASAGALIFFLYIWFILMFFVLWMVFVVGGMVLWITMLIDVSKREFPKPEDRTLWILVVALAGLVGATIYYFSIKRPADKLKA